MGTLSRANVLWRYSNCRNCRHPPLPNGQVLEDSNRVARGRTVAHVSPCSDKFKLILRQAAAATFLYDLVDDEHDHLEQSRRHSGRHDSCLGFMHRRRAGPSLRKRRRSTKRKHVRLQVVYPAVNSGEVGDEGGEGLEGLDSGAVCVHLEMCSLFIWMMARIAETETECKA